MARLIPFNFAPFMRSSSHPRIRYVQLIQADTCMLSSLNFSAALHVPDPSQDIPTAFIANPDHEIRLLVDNDVTFPVLIHFCLIRSFYTILPRSSLTLHVNQNPTGCLPRSVHIQEINLQALDSTTYRASQQPPEAGSSIDLFIEDQSLRRSVVYSNQTAFVMRVHIFEKSHSQFFNTGHAGPT